MTTPNSRHTQKLNLLIIILLLFSGLNYLSLSHAKPPNVYKMPLFLFEQLRKETEQRRRGECEQKKQALNSTHFYALTDNKLLILIELPDYFCYSSSFMPVTINNQGQWEMSSVIESRPSELLTDTTGQLWLLSYFENEAVFPILHHSIDGKNWQEINLPKSSGIDCCFEYIKQICVKDAKIQLKLTGIDDTQQEYWETTVKDSVTTTPHWQKLAAKYVKNSNLCETKPLTNGNWQRNFSKNNEEVSFKSATIPITITIPAWLK